MQVGKLDSASDFFGHRIDACFFQAAMLSRLFWVSFSCMYLTFPRGEMLLMEESMPGKPKFIVDNMP